MKIDALNYIEQILMLKFKLELSKQQKRLFLEQTIAYTNAISYILEKNLKDKSTNVKKLHRLYYKEVREKFNLPAQLAVNVIRETSAIYKTLWAQFKELKRRKPNSKSVKKFWDKPPKRKSLIAKYTHNRTFSVKPDKLVVSLSTYAGRVKNIPIKGWNKHYEYLKQGKISDPILVYDKSSKTFFIYIPITLKVPQQKPRQIVGVDLGERHIFGIASTTEQKELIDIPDEYKHRKQRYHSLRSELMSKGTRSAKRKLQKNSRREKRFTENVLHIMAKQLISKYPNAKFVFEDLTQIRQNRITYRGKNKEARRHAEQWPFASIISKVIYKNTIQYGIESEKVNPYFTSQTCPVCGHVDPNNRPNKGEVFTCTNCDYTEHADIVGAINIALRYIVKKQDENLKGLLVSQPNAPRELT